MFISMDRVWAIYHMEFYLFMPLESLHVFYAGGCVLLLFWFIQCSLWGILFMCATVSVCYFSSFQFFLKLELAMSSMGIFYLFVYFLTSHTALFYGSKQVLCFASVRFRTFWFPSKTDFPGNEKEHLKVTLLRIDSALQGVLSCLPDFHPSIRNGNTKDQGYISFIIAGASGSTVGSSEMREKAAEIIHVACK